MLSGFSDWAERIGEPSPFDSTLMSIPSEYDIQSKGQKSIPQQKTMLQESAMKASKKEIEEKVAELNTIGRDISLQDDTPPHNKIEEQYIKEIKEMLESGYYATPPSDWRLGSNGYQGDVLAWRAARYISGELSGERDKFPNKEQPLDEGKIRFPNFQEARIWAIENPKMVITRSSDGTGFEGKINEKK